MNKYTYKFDDQFDVRNYFGSFELLSVVIDVTLSDSLDVINETRKYRVRFTGKGEKGWCLPADPIRMRHLRYYDDNDTEIQSTTF